MKATITLYDGQGEIQSSGQVRVLGTKRRVSLGLWVWGAEHIHQRPLKLVGRIARDWAFDGGSREYEGWDDKSACAFRIEPSKEE